MDLSKLSKKQLKDYKKVLSLLSFLGVSQEDLQSISILKDKVEALEEEVKDLKIKKQNLEKLGSEAPLSQKRMNEYFFGE